MDERALEAAARALYENEWGGDVPEQWEAVVQAEKKYWTKSAQACIAAYREASEEARPTHRHRKRGLYQVLMRGVHEKDLQPVVIYRATSDGAVWVRYASEFDDGRFTPIDTALEGK